MYGCCLSLVGVGSGTAFVGDQIDEVQLDIAYFESGIEAVAEVGSL